MPVQAACPKCKKPLSLGDDLGNRPVKCPSCGATIRITPSAESASRQSGAGSARPASSGGSKSASGLPERISRYSVRKVLGEGAFGVVYKCHDPSLDREVAIKKLRPDALGSAKYVERFLREAKVVARMLHGNIVPVYELGEEQGAYFIASAFIPGQSLADIIPENGLEAGRAVRLVLQLLEALAYAHDQGVLHRDVKSSNAMLGEKDTLFLMDFGLAGWVGQDSGRMTQDGAVMGTPSYMPPEQASGQIQGVGPAADQYSAGVVLYELLTGHLPFEGGPIQAILFNVINTPPPPLSEFRPDVDPQLEAICLKAMAKKPEERFVDCRGFIDALKSWQAGTGGVAVSRENVLEVIPVSPKAEPPATVRSMAAGQRSTVNNPPQRRAVAEPSPEPVVIAEPPALRKATLPIWAFVAGAALFAALLIIGGAGYVVYTKLNPGSGAAGAKTALGEKQKRGD
jgi:tRNA A-37 threonylcarbamoyl transferase component Bud32